MGKKYIIEIGRLERLYKAFIGAHGKPEITWLSPEVDLTPYTEPDTEAAYAHGYSNAELKYRAEVKEAYQQGLSDAWEAARKICTNWVLSDSVLSEIFGMDKTIDDIMKENTASEVIEKIRQYEQIQEEDGLRHNIQTIVDQCGYSLDEIAEVLRKMRENNG